MERSGKLRLRVNRLLIGKVDFDDARSDAIMPVWNLSLPLLKLLISLIPDPLLRHRVLVACTRCREKKTKCDGEKPCGSCTGNCRIVGILNANNSKCPLMDQM